jgi:hypothetical protein
MLLLYRYELALLAVLLIVCTLLWPVSGACQELVDRVVASVGTTAITLSEFQERFAALKAEHPDTTEEAAINSMINGILLLEKARQMRLEGKSADDLIAEYINVKIRAAVLIRDEEIDRYLSDHRLKPGSQENASVRAKVEELLTEQEVNKALERHLKELRDGADIRIQFSGKE